MSGVQLSEEQLRRRRSRSIALAWILAALMAIIFAVTIVRLGGNVMNRPL